MKNLMLFEQFESPEDIQTGPLYHGAAKDNFESIIKNGFKIPNPKSFRDAGNHVWQGPTLSGRGTKETSFFTRGEFENAFGREMRYRMEAPMHFFGFGIYFTRYKTAALMRYSWSGNNSPYKNSVKTHFFIDAVPVEVRILKPLKMWHWWESHGYNYEEVIAPRLDEVLDLHEKEKRDKQSKIYMAKREIIESARFEATVNMTNVLKSKYDLLEYPLKYGLDSAQLCCFDPTLITSKNAQ